MLVSVGTKADAAAAGGIGCANRAADATEVHCSLHGEACTFFQIQNCLLLFLH